MVIPPEIADRILAGTLGRPEAHRLLAYLADRIGGRTAGAESGRMAEEWAHGLLSGWGASDVRYEEVPVDVWMRRSLVATVTAPVQWHLTAIAHGNAPGAADISGAVIDAGHGDAAGYEQLHGDAAGRIALCDEGATEGQRHLHRTEKLLIAARNGARALLILSSAAGGLPRTGVCARGEAPIPSLGISQEDGERLRRLLRDGIAPSVHISMRNHIEPGITRTVLADIPGTDRSSEVVLAGGHMDSWDIAQGATDNGIGVAIVLEAARVLLSLPDRPRRTIRFALWAGEEVGLLGSKHYVATHEAELPHHVAVMNFDMTGDPYGYHTIGYPKPAPLLSNLAKQLAPLGMHPEFSAQASLHSDHQPFWLQGVPTIQLQARLSEDGARYYHSIGDTLEKVDMPALHRAAAVGAFTLWALAQAAEPPYPHMDATAVRAAIDDAGLYDALVADGFDGAPMHLNEEKR